MNRPGEEATISRGSLPLASRGFRMVERVRGAIQWLRRQARIEQEGSSPLPLELTMTHRPSAQYAGFVPWAPAPHTGIQRPAREAA